MINASIAELSVQVNGGDPDFFPVRFRNYESINDTVDLSLTLKRATDIEVPVGDEIIRRNGMVLLRAQNGDICRYTVGQKSGRVLHVCRSSTDYSRWEYTLWEERKHSVFSLTDFEYMYSGEAFANRMAYTGGLVMHGSAIAYDGRGIIFSAPSGTGKSTHAGLWKALYGDRVMHINDDKPAIRFKKGEPYVYGTPWSGKTDINNNVSAPLKAIVFLKQAPENRLSPISVAEAMTHIHRETVRPFYDEALGIKVLDTTERLIQSVPCFLLDCTISDEAVKLVKNAMHW